MSNLIGQSLGRYHILEQLGEGGMSIVYKAYDTRLETDVAVKVIRVENLTLGTMERALKRFEREAKALARLNHQNIVNVTDYGEYEGKPYLVMPYFPGGTLKQKLGKPIPWQEAVEMLLPIAEALDYAHSQKMVHRDVKPANILLTERGQPMLTDFGIAKVLDIEETMDLTGTSAAVGTPEYMAPEQATAKIADHRADIYALGIVLYEMITGRKPYSADTPMAVLIMHARDPLPRPSKFASGIPDAVEKILIKALAKSPDDRYQSMAEMVAALEGLFGGKRKDLTKVSLLRKKEKKPEPEKAPTKRSWNAQKTIVAVALIGLVLAGVFGIPALFAQKDIVSMPTFSSTEEAKQEPLPTKTLTVTAGPSSTPSKISTPTAIIKSSAIPTNTNNNTPIFTPVLRPLILGDMIVSFSSETISSSNIDRLTELGRFDTVGGEVFAFSPDGKYIAVGFDYGTVRIWNLSDGTLIHKFGGLAEHITDIKFSPDSKLIAASSGYDYFAKVKLWKISDGLLYKSFPQSNTISAIAFSNNGTLIAIGTRQTHYLDKTVVQVWDFENENLLNEFSDIDTEELTFSLQDDKIIVAPFGYGSNEIRIWQIADGKMLDALPLVGTKHLWVVAFGMAISPNGEILAAAGDKLRWWNLGDNSLILDIESEQGRSRSKVSFSPDGNLLANFAPGVLEIWDVDSKTKITDVQMQYKYIDCMDFYPDGRIFAYLDKRNSTISFFGIK
jgi:serine/threonine protein kinase